MKTAEKVSPSIAVDPSDLPGLIQIMDEYGDTEMPFFGKNESGEEVIIGVCPDSIAVDTFQSNGWLRRNIYYRDGSSEELFDGRWK